MNNQRGILKNVIIFMASFIFVTLLSVIILAGIMFFLPAGRGISEYMPISNVVNVEEINWEHIEEAKGLGIILDNEGDVIKSFNFKNEKNNYSINEVLNLFNLRNSKHSTLVYDTTDGNKLLLSYPKSILSLEPTLNLNNFPGKNIELLPYALLLLLGFYIFLIYLVIRMLNNRLAKELKLMQTKEEERKDLLFRGLAHDIKTPLAAVIAYSSALKDNLVDEGEIDNYHTGIYRNGQILKERVEDMLNLTTLSDKGFYNPNNLNLLETIRRYAGENYTWYLDRGANIDLDFQEDEEFFIKHDVKLIERVLQNILENSVLHNEKNVNISISFDKIKKTLTFKDDGIGIPKEIQEIVFEPMITGDKSRTGDKLRGMGLANVKRIVNLHGWEVEYKDGIVINMK
ncbi:MAG: HAMP domain-containing histidine kinase [Tissierellia bacterium]|nr:HAMP domain-containing histidine kinase [Tissierellia bacterium]